MGMHSVGGKFRFESAMRTGMEQLCKEFGLSGEVSQSNLYWVDIFQSREFTRLKPGDLN